MSRSQTLVPKQARSRESLAKLLKATVQVLGQHGVAGTTIPRIATHAGLTPGAIYRRFRNKNVLLESAILRVFENQDKVLRLSLTLESAAALSLFSLADQLISTLVLSYRANAGLLRAMRQLLQENEGSAFWKKATRLEMQTFEYLVSILLSSRTAIKHPDPRAAVSLGLVMVVGTLWEVVVNPGDARLWAALMPTDNPTLKRELMRSFLSYLGVEEGS